MDQIYRASVYVCQICGYTFMMGEDLADCIGVDKITTCPICQNNLKYRNTWIKEFVPGAINNLKRG